MFLVWLEVNVCLFSDLNLLNVLQIGNCQTGEFMFRYDRGFLPPAYNDFFSYVFKVHSHYTRNCTIYGRIFACTNTADFPLNFWEFQYGKKFNSQFACLRMFIFK